jgi:integrase
MHLKASRTASGQPIKTHVVNLTLFLLRDILEYAITCGYMHDNPTLHVRLLPVQTSKAAVVVGQDEWKAVKEQCLPEKRPVLDFLRMTGLRLSELLGLTWRQVDWQHNCLVIDGYPARRYPGRNREIPLVNEAGEILKSMKELAKGSGENLSGKVVPLNSSLSINFENELAVCSQKAGVNPPVSLQMIRNTFACEILQKGVSFLKMAQFMGFSDVAQAMRYACFVKEGQYE